VRLDARIRNTLLIAVTGWGQASDKERALEAGFDVHFTKPVEPTALIDLLGEKLPTR
jgi:CheY-like chemotaxis protein